MTHFAPQWVRRLAAFGVGLAAVALSLTPASALSEGSIDHIEPGDGSIEVLYSVPGEKGDIAPDLASVTISLEGLPLEASATFAESSSGTVRRTTILAVDVSNSMRGVKFEEAKLAADAYLASVPADVYVGIVTFAGKVATVLAPTLDRAAARAAVDDLQLSNGTRLYDGVIEAAKAAGSAGQRTVLMLSDGKDTSKTPLGDALGAISDSELKVDVVTLGREADDAGPLFEMAAAGAGAVIEADDPDTLSEMFAAEAEALARQVLITGTLPANADFAEGTLEISIQAGDETYSSTAFVTLDAGERTSAGNVNAPAPVPAPKFMVTNSLMLLGLGATGLALLFVMLVAFGAFEKSRTESLEDRIAAYQLTRDPRAAAGTPGVRITVPQRPDSLVGTAVGAAQKALANNRGVEAALGNRLEAAGMAMKPAEWLLLHAAITTAAGLTGLLLSNGGIALTLLMVAAGALLPWLYLGIKRKRRLKAFNAQLADVLQLMSGSLSAGLSLAQSADTVVREGSEPVAGEFKRALIETRLGVQIEDTLDAVAERMESHDFHWVVMAVRIQREVGGNLAELLLTVAATLREREYLRRQVRALSAEGRMSAWILGGLPPGFMLYLSMVNRDYLTPMFSTPLGWALLVAMVVMLSVGVLWMSKMVKVEV